MQRLLLCKQTTSPTIAHLYEHLAMNELKRVMHRAGLYKQIDYYALGTHYLETGYMTIDIDMYTDAPIAMASNLEQLAPSITDDTIQLAMQQIAAETESYISCGDTALLYKTLNDLNTTTWQTPATLEQPIIIDTPTDRSSLRNIATPASSIDHVSYSLIQPKPDDPALLPLIYYLAAAVHSTVADIANYSLGYYDMGEQCKHETSQFISTQEFAVMHHKANDDAMRAIYRSVIAGMAEPAAIDRICQRLRSFDYRSGLPNTPNIDVYALEVGVVIGESAWRKLATENTIRSVVNRWKFR